jgi:hypothetical protein
MAVLAYVKWLHSSGIETLAWLTKVLSLSNLRVEHGNVNAGILGSGEAAFSHDHQVLARNVERPDRLVDDLLADIVCLHAYSISSIRSSVISSFENRESLGFCRAYRGFIC